MTPRARLGVASVCCGLLAAVLTSPVAASADPSVGGTATCGGATTTIRGTRGDDVLVGTAGPDVVAAGTGDDVVRGLGGDDLLCGGAGADVVSGGPGTDLVDGGTDALEEEDNDYFVAYGDRLSGGPGDDRLVAGPPAEEPVDELSFSGAAAGVVVDLVAGTATGEGDDALVGAFRGVSGSQHDDVLLGTDGEEQLLGGNGSDRLEGRGGADFLAGAASTGTDAPDGDDVLLGGLGSDEAYGERGDDVLDGGPGRDNLHGGAGLDRVRGGAGPDQLGDHLVPGEGQVLDAGVGRDEMGEVFLLRPDGEVHTTVTGRTDLAAGTLRATWSGRTTLVRVTGFEDASFPSVSGRWVLLGTDGPDVLLAGYDQGGVLRGRGGDDLLGGSRGDDVLDGGPGRDRAYGSGGRDRFVAVERVQRY